MIVHGTIRPPGDKSITHRALFFAALSRGRCRIDGALTSGDARSTARVLRQLGVQIDPLRGGCTVFVVPRRWRRPTATLDCGNSGTTARLLLGALAGQPFRARVTGDASLRKRPMRRVTGPLTRMGARFDEENGDGLPLVVHGGPLAALDYDAPTASAQVKGSLVLAGLVSGVSVTFREPARSRDHTERMLRALGVRVDSHDSAFTVTPGPVSAFELSVPGDISSAAFLIGAALLAEGGELTIRDVGINPTRTGFLNAITRMGASLDILPTGERLGEPVGDLVVRPGPLHATAITPAEVPSLIDEIPMLAVLASRAEGETVFRGVAELAVKESDRLRLIAENLRRLGVDVEARPDTLRVTGTSKPPRGRVDTAKDHRLAMAFAVLGKLPGARVQLSERKSVAVSYPGFFDDLREISRRG